MLKEGKKKMKKRRGPYGYPPVKNILLSPNKSLLLIYTNM